MPAGMTDRVLSLHNHTPFSVGAFTIDEIVEAHLDGEGVRIDGVGISDYLFRTPTSHEPKNDREFEQMFGREARQYVSMVHEARKSWAGKMDIYCGAEINWPLNKTMLKSIRNMLSGIDYVMFSHLDWAGLTQLASQARRWPCAVGLCQTSIDADFPSTSHDQVIRTMANARLFYGVSASFLPLRDSDPWYKLLPKHRVPIALGCDTHDDLDCIGEIRPLYEYVKRCGLHERLLDPTNNHSPARQKPAAAEG